MFCPRPRNVNAVTLSRTVQLCTVHIYGISTVRPAERRHWVVLSVAVEVIALLSNPANQQEWRELLQETDMGEELATGERSRTRRSRQPQRRLERAEVAALVEAYRSGAGVQELAARYGLHRNSVRDTLRRQGVSPRQRSLNPRQVRETSELYASGRSIAELADRFNVHPSTAWRALKSGGVGDVAD